MNFLYPGFLFALFAVAIPVIIHLFNFRKFKRVYFSNVAFLKEIKEQTSSQEKLKNLLILLSRILAILFLVFAFAKPYLPTQDKIDASKGNVVSVFIDNSYSLEAVNKEGSLLDEAKRKAKEVAKAFQINDRFQLLTNDFEGKHQRLLNSEEFLLAVDEVKISPANRTLQQVINRQQSIFKGTANRFAYLISDYQKGFAGDNLVEVDPNTNISFIKLDANDLPNVAVDSVWLLSPVHQPNNTEKLVVQLKNYGEEDAKNIAVKLEINNQQKAISSLNIDAGKTALDTLSYSGLNLGWQKGKISIKDFPLTFDDQLNFSFNVNKEQKILAINGAQSGRYIRALFGADAYFNLSEMAEASINYGVLQNYGLIILNELNNPPSGLAQELKAYIENGGSVLIFPDLNANLQVYTSFLTSLNLPAVAELNIKPIKVSGIELKHPLFKDVFENLPQNLDLPQVNRYFSYANSSSNNKEELLSLPANNFFFAKFNKGNGAIFLAATGLNSDDTNFAKNTLFVPLLYKIAFSSVREQPIYYVTTQNNILEVAKTNIGTNQSLKLEADGFEIIPEIRQANGKTLLYTADQIKTAGFYDVKQSDSTLAVVAFNDNRVESDMHFDEREQLEKLFAKKQVTFLDAKSDSLSSVTATKNNGTELWKLCLILSLVFIAAEILLIRFYHTENRAGELIDVKK